MCFFNEDLCTYQAMIYRMNKNAHPNFWQWVHTAIQEKHTIEHMSLVAWFPSYGPLKIKTMPQLQHSLTQTSTSLHVVNITLFVPFEVSNQWSRWVHSGCNHQYASDTWLNLWHWTWCMPLCPNNTASLYSRFKHFFAAINIGLGENRPCNVLPKDCGQL